MLWASERATVTHTDSGGGALGWSGGTGDWARICKPVKHWPHYLLQGTVPSMDLLMGALLYLVPCFQRDLLQ